MATIYPMNEKEGKELAAIPKWGEPRSQWAQDRPNTFTNAFGVVNKDGQSIKGLQVELEVFVSPRLGISKFVFSLKQFELGRPERAYQLHINGRKGVLPREHAYCHEHYGEPRFQANASWAGASFEDAVKRFCANTTLTLTDEMPDYQGFNLK